jgi:hypothetical protein
MARHAGRDVAVGIAELDQAHDGRRGLDERRRIRIALRLGSVVSGNICEGGLVERLRVISWLVRLPVL